MAQERPTDWAVSKTKEWHLGHFHHKREYKFSAGNTFNGVSVRILPSLSGTDAWHFEKGFVKQPAVAEAYIFSKENGYVGHFASIPMSS
jgi:hypothetical protein